MMPGRKERTASRPFIEVAELLRCAARPRLAMSKDLLVELESGYKAVAMRCRATKEPSCGDVSSARAQAV